MKFVGIDVGRDSVKVASDDLFSFKSAVGEWRERRLINNLKYEVEIDGQKYFVGDLAAESYLCREMVTESKIHEETKILFLTALALSVTLPFNFQVITGLPLSQHTPQLKRQLNDLLCGKHLVKVNGEKKAFNIKEVLVVGEGAGALWDMVLNDEGKQTSNFLTQKKVRTVDIGSRTINYCTTEKMRYLDRDSGTITFGCIELYNLNPEPTAGELEQFARKITAELARRWANLKATDVILFTGGGSILLKPYLEKQHPLAVFATEPIFANARGYQKMGLARWQKGN